MSASPYCFYIKRTTSRSPFICVRFTRLRYLAGIQRVHVCAIDLQGRLQWTILLNDLEGFAFNDIATLNKALNYFDFPTKRYTYIVDVPRDSEQWRELQTLNSHLLESLFT